MRNTQFMQYGEEWKSEMKKLTKDVIINICSQIGIEKQKEIDRLKEGLKEIVSPILFMQDRLQEGEKLNGMMAIQLSEDPNYLKEIAKKVLFQKLNKRNFLIKKYE
jgi:hypothetical protein